MDQIIKDMEYKQQQQQVLLEDCQYQNIKDEDIDNNKQIEININSINKQQYEEDVKFDSLSKLNIWGYGVGHFLNDLCAACWFNFLSIYLKNINPITKDETAGQAAGIVLLCGQVFDGIATPLVGYFSDKTQTKIGKRKPWYIFGYVTVVVCFIFIFQNCILCSSSSSDITKIVYYSFFASAFNIGWASLQISHMALVPSLSICRIRRDKLNSVRNTFTYIANFAVLIIAAFLFAVNKNSNEDFGILSFLVIGIGTLTSIFFMMNINEVQLTKDCHKYQKNIQFIIMKENRRIQEQEEGKFERRQSNENNSNLNSMMVQSMSDSRNECGTSMKWYDWFKKVKFYQYCLCYTGVRVTNNLIMTMLTFYTRYVIVVSEVDISQSIPFQFALFPLVMYIFSIIGSSLIDYLQRKIKSRKIIYGLGAFNVLLASFLFYIIEKENYEWVYLVMAISGFGQAICLNTGINMISEVIGVSGQSGAFVFGVYSLFDKFASGILIYLLLGSKQMESNDPHFIRLAISIIPAVGCLLAWIMMLLGTSTHKLDTQSHPLIDLSTHNKNNLSHPSKQYQIVCSQFAGELQSNKL